MVRKQVYIEVRQEAMLKARARQLGVPEAVLIRDGIDCLFEKGAAGGPDGQAWQEASGFIRRWGRRGRVEGGRSWRREDIYGGR